MIFQQKIKIAKELQHPDREAILGEIIRDCIIKIMYKIEGKDCIGGIYFSVQRHNNFVFDDMSKNEKKEAQRMKDAGVFEYVITVQN